MIEQHSLPTSMSLSASLHFLGDPQLRLHVYARHELRQPVADRPEQEASSGSRTIMASGDMTYDATPLSAPPCQDHADRTPQRGGYFSERSRDRQVLAARSDLFQRLRAAASICKLPVSSSVRSSQLTIYASQSTSLNSRSPGLSDSTS